MDFNVLTTSGYRLDCDRDEVASMMVTAPPAVTEASHAPATPETTDSERRRARKDKHKKRSKDKKEKKSHRSLREAAPDVIAAPSGDKGKGRRGVNGEEEAKASTPTVKVVAPSEEVQAAYVAPAILELVFAAPKSGPPDLAEFPMAVAGSSTVAEIKEQLFQKERYLLRTMQFHYEGRELKVPPRTSHP